jgi:hypothetical protein
MKKIFLIFATLSFCCLMHGQNVVVIGGNSPETKDDCIYRINGICISEDIGGVEVSSRKIGGGNDRMRLVFKNYNDFAVSVVYELQNGPLRLKSTGTIILESGEEKETDSDWHSPRNFKLISRKFDISSNTALKISDKVITLMGYLHVFPDDLGEFREYPANVIESINRNKAHGIGNWRLPTEAELSILQQNHERLQLTHSTNVREHYASESSRIETWSRALRVRLVATEE